MNTTSWLLLVLVQLDCFHCCYSATHHHGRKHARPLLTAPTPAAVATATVVGSVVVVVHSSSSEATTAVSGTLVGVRCHDGNGRPVIHKDVVTDRSGKFHVHLERHEPSSSSQKLQSITSCSVAVHLPQAPPCVATTSARGLHLISHTNHNKHHHHGGGGARIFSAGAFAVRPELCSQKGIFFPPVPLVPEPPNIGGVPIPPNPVTPAPPSLVPPLLPTPSPPSVLPPLVPQPPPSSIVPPLLPPLVNPPPPPPPPQLLPPVPLLPPVVPGVPPASASSKNRRTGNP
ncbi:proline-rich protein 2 [Sorghum bicolor]|uniref:Pollen Ole e 1 allergen and extensin family protein n=1 Tax=Sorghum bicolor TaxID=4558 RepID=C5Y4M4_SORBI|nr:proline-rich protein 2 [Sorghum bicolor]EES09261.1 hypothetical protein SORBI_3005G036000 [Sorghum bicolor]|eukprot:XP_002450273.1 proline-rich protein 2 [Sorghum bicolor]